MDEPKSQAQAAAHSRTYPGRQHRVIAADDHCRRDGAFRQIGEDVTEELGNVPGRGVGNRIARPRYACNRCERFTQSGLPSRPVEHGRPGPGILTHALVSKCADQLPLYRQSQIFECEGIALDRSTLADWVGKTITPLALQAR